MSLFEDYDVPLRPDKIKTKQDMEVISIERSTYEDYRLYGIMGRWPILKSTASCSISLRMWRVFFML